MTNQSPAGGDVTVSKLLRAMATGTIYKDVGHDIILNKAADLIDAYLAKLTSTKAEPSRIAYKEAGEKLTDAPTLVKLLALGDERAGKDLLQRVQVARDFLAQATDHITAIEADLNDYKHWADDVRHLTRLLDIELNGDNAAKQASLCDLIGSIKPLKDDKDRLTKALARARTYVEMSYDENGGEEAAEAKHDLKEIDLALSPPSTSQSEGEG